MQKNGVNLSTKIYNLSLPTTDDGHGQHLLQSYRRLPNGQVLSATDFVESDHKAAEFVQGKDVFSQRLKDRFPGAMVDDALMDMDGCLSVEIPVDEIDKQKISDADVCRLIETVADGVGYDTASSTSPFGAG